MNLLAGFTPPKTVCLCGSTRFRAEYEYANRLETLAGRIVLSVGFYTHADAATVRALYSPDGPKSDGARKRCEGNKELQLGADVAEALDRLHLWKIDRADEILIVTDSTKYVGRSTRAEICFAETLGKRVRWLVDEVPLAQLRSIACA